MLTETIVHKIQVKEFAKPFVAQVTAVIPMGINFGVSPRQGGRSKLGVRSYGWLAASQKFPRVRTWNLNDLLGDDEATFSLIFLLFGQSESLPSYKTERGAKNCAAVFLVGSSTPAPIERSRFY